MDSRSRFVSDFFPSKLRCWDSRILLPGLVVHSFLLFNIRFCEYPQFLCFAPDGHLSCFQISSCVVKTWYFLLTIHCVVTLYCGFVLHFLVTNEVVQLLMCLSVHLNTFFCGMSVQVFCPFKKKKGGLGLPWWSSGWESTCLCGHRFDPWSGKIPHTGEQLSPCPTTTEACTV